MLAGIGIRGRFKARLMPCPRNAFETVEHVTAVVETNVRDPGGLTSERHLTILERMVEFPLPPKLL
jgi:hypothetical protein